MIIRIKVQIQHSPADHAETFEATVTGDEDERLFKIFLRAANEVWKHIRFWLGPEGELLNR